MEVEVEEMMEGGRFLRIESAREAGCGVVAGEEVEVVEAEAVAEAKVEAEVVAEAEVAAMQSMELQAPVLSGSHTLKQPMNGIPNWILA